MNKNKKRLIKISACVCALTLIVGSFAFFTDRTEQSATATAGNINLAFTDTSLKAESLGDDVQAIDSVWDNSSLVAPGGVLNPGDTIDMDYKIANTGSKSIDVRQRITLTSDKALSEGDAAEYKIVVGGQEITPVITTDENGTTAVYYLENIILNGSVETEDGIDVTEQEYEVAMAFAKAAMNKFMDSNVTVTLEAQAKQHRNTSDVDFGTDWTTLATVEEIAD